jgi:hypothetical protein
MADLENMATPGEQSQRTCWTSWNLLNYRR